jgi:hypothetical protein
MEGMFTRRATTTVTRSPKGSASALDRRTEAEARKRARIAGIFFVVTFISIAALPLYHPVLKDHSFIVGAGGDTRVQLGALAEIITAIAGIELVRRSRCIPFSAARAKASRWAT